MKTRCTHGGAFHRKLRIGDVVVVGQDEALPDWQNMCVPNFWYRNIYSLPSISTIFEPLPRAIYGFRVKSLKPKI